MKIFGFDVIHIAAAGAAIAAAAAPLNPVHPLAGASTPVLASVDFQGDAVGATARPFGPPTVQADLWEDSTTTSGSSAVVSAGGTARRYRISDAGSESAYRGVRLPFSSTVNSGTLDLRATVTADQTGSEGGTLACDDPVKHDWFGRMGFGGDGKFAVQGASTGVSYAAGTKYLFRMTVNFGSPATADFRIWNLDSNELIYTSTGNALEGTPTAAAVCFRTGVADNGAFTIDDISASN